MSEIRKCPDCGEPRYAQGKGSHVETGLAECKRELTFEQAEAMLPDGPVQHTFVGGDGFAIGADDTRDQVLALIRAGHAYRSGPMASALRHGLCVIGADGEPVFIETAHVNKEGDWLICLCGNRPDMDGFYPCLADGTVVEPVDNGPWQGKLHACAKCGRIIDYETLEVTGRRDPAGIIEESTS